MREKCNKNNCTRLVQKYKSLKVEKESLERKMAHQLESYRRDVAMSDVAARWAESEELNKELMLQVKDATKRRNHADNEVKELAAERRQLVADGRRIALAHSMASKQVLNMAREQRGELREWKAECTKVIRDGEATSRERDAAIVAKQRAEARAEIAEAAEAAAEAKLAEAVEAVNAATEATMEAEDEAAEAAAACA